MIEGEKTSELSGPSGPAAIRIRTLLPAAEAEAWVARLGALAAMKNGAKKLEARAPLDAVVRWIE